MWLIGMNVIYFIFGILLISLSSWGIAVQNGTAATSGSGSGLIASLLPAASLNTLVTVGVFLLILSLVGCFGVRFNYKLGGRYALGFYAFFMVLIMLMEFIASIAIFTWVGVLDSPATQVSNGAISVRCRAFIYVSLSALCSAAPIFLY